jgi:hypothetical protein
VELGRDAFSLSGRWKHRTRTQGRARQRLGKRPCPCSSLSLPSVGRSCVRILSALAPRADRQGYYAGEYLT